MDVALTAAAECAAQWLQQRHWMLATAESCTAGWIAKTITDIAGSSAWFDCGFVTYSNTAKQTMLGVDAETLIQSGAVSEQTVVEMAHGALERSQADVVLAVSGIAGPGGGSSEKPVGTVWFAWGDRNGQMYTACRCFQPIIGENVRESVRRQTVICALEGLMTHSWS